MEEGKLYWFVSVPKRGKHGFRDVQVGGRVAGRRRACAHLAVQARVEKPNWGTCSPFQLPDLRIGTRGGCLSFFRLRAPVRRRALQRWTFQPTQRRGGSVFAGPPSFEAASAQCEIRVVQYTWFVRFVEGFPVAPL